MDQEIKPWRKLVIIFPGQGSQHAGMGRRLAEISKAARDVFRRADDVLDMQISRMCFEGEEAELESTINQQPATFVTSMAWLAALQERLATLDRKIEPVLFAGHSLGEFSAAVAAGSLTFDEGALLVKERGILMDEAGRENPGGMASILGLSEEKVAEICKEASSEGYVGLATANCEGQNVISGAMGALRRAMELAEKARARRVVKLPISIASHSPLMSRASEGMNRLLQRLQINDPKAPLVGNVHADILDTKPKVYHELRDQLLSGVLWAKSVETMKSRGADLFIEVGPGNVLTRLVRRIDYDVNSLSVSDENEGLFSENWKRVEAAAL
ncbi:MAG: ACP S-malonyltransferase [Dehalococcoidia bacterium]